MHFNGLNEQRKFQGWLEESSAKRYIDRELYRLKRYGCPVTIGMCRCGDPQFEKKFDAYSRRTDHLVRLAEGHYIFLFDHTEIPGAVKATENLMLHMELHNEKNRVAITQLHPDDDLDSALKRLLTLFVIASKSDSLIVDDSVLSH